MSLYGCVRSAARAGFLMFLGCSSAVGAGDAMSAISGAGAGASAPSLPWPSDGVVLARGSAAPARGSSPASNARAGKRPVPAPAGVLLFAGPVTFGSYVSAASGSDADDLYEIPARHVVPIACRSGDGNVRGGSACLARTPARTSIRVDEETLPVRRVARVAACHSPYEELPAPTSTGLALGEPQRAFRPRTLAVWPASADVGLEIVAPRADRQEAALYLDLDGDAAAERVIEQMDGGGRSRGARLPGATWIDITGGKDANRRVRLEPSTFRGASRLMVLATSDVDRDGLRELIVFAEYVNDYGVAVIEYGSTEPAYSFNCGNI